MGVRAVRSGMRCMPIQHFGNRSRALQSGMHSMPYYTVQR